MARYPETMYCASYQDGLQHSLERAINLAHTGRYSHTCVLDRKFHEYEQIRKIHFKKRSYHDAAYAEGYMNGLMLLLTEEDLSRGMPAKALLDVLAEDGSHPARGRSSE